MSGDTAGAAGGAGVPEPVVPHVDATLRRERRPSGDKPPLPYVIDRRARVLLFLAIVAAAAWVITMDRAGQDWWLPQLDASLLESLVDLRSSFVVDVADALNGVQQLPWPYVVAVPVILALLVTRRIRRLAVLAGSLLVTMVVTITSQLLLAQPRPYEVEIVGTWSGYGGLAVGACYLTCVLVAAVLSLAPAGRPRAVAGAAVAVLVVLLVLASAVLGTQYPVAGLVGVGLAAAVTLLVHWVFAPDESFPVQYGKVGNSAHLDLGGARGDAIRQAMASQLGFEVQAIKPFGLSGSAGSSPMRVTVAGDPPHNVFAKLFAQQHLRADRIYKLTRSLIYGRLEDERRFVTVKRLAQNEDYLMRVFRDAGAPVVESHGVVELTPEREYLLVTGFADGSREIGDPETVVDDDLVDQGLAAIRHLWDAGLAHRDVKPANYLVSDGQLVMIDLGFAEVRPSPWRQAVDLANMMLILALKTDAPRVYAAAQRYFTPDEIAEAFAASKGLTVPTQLQAYLKADGRDLLGEFRRLAPDRQPISIQRWSVRRVGLLAGAAAAVVATLVLAGAVFFGYDVDEVGLPKCRDSTPVLLFAQSQPEAESVPCLIASPASWRDVSTVATSDGGTLRASRSETDTALTVTFRAACDLTGARPRPDLAVDGADEVLELPSTDPATAAVAIPVPGACTTVQVTGGSEATRVETVEVTLAVLLMVPRSELDANVAERTGGWATSLS